MDRFCAVPHSSYEEVFCAFANFLLVTKLVLVLLSYVTFGSVRLINIVLLLHQPPFPWFPLFHPVLLFIVTPPPLALSGVVTVGGSSRYFGKGEYGKSGLL